MSNIIHFILKLFKIIRKNKQEPVISDSSINNDVIVENTSEKENILELPENYDLYSKYIVCLDNGHGIDTIGKGSPYALNNVSPELYIKEYEYCRNIVSEIEKGLTSLGIEVYKVCPEENDISLSTRYKRANDKISSSNKKGIFISVHLNAAGSGYQWMTGKGWSAYTTKGQNNSDILAECLYDAAEEVFSDIKDYTVKIRKDTSDGDRDYEENFTVIYGANMPAVLTENLFQDNIDDVSFLLSKKGQNSIVKLHIKGIKEFIYRINNNLK